MSGAARDISGAGGRSNRSAAAPHHRGPTASQPLVPADPPPLRLGLAGQGIGHSLSPKLHGALLAAAGLQGQYRLFDTGDLQPLLAALRRGELDGLNVTTPLKAVAAAACEGWLDGGQWREGPAALPVNTLWRRGGALVGASTDGYGMLEALRAAGWAPEDGAVVVLGAGGAAAAVVSALCAVGCAVVVAARREDQAALVAQQLGGRSCPVAEVPEAVAAVIHLSRWGHGQADPGPAWHGPSPWDELPWQAWSRAAVPPLCLDAVYAASGLTPWERLAAARGIPRWTSPRERFDLERHAAPRERFDLERHAAPRERFYLERHAAPRERFDLERCRGGVVGGAGRWMLMAQAAASFSLWTGCVVPWTGLWDAPVGSGAST